MSVGRVETDTGAEAETKQVQISGSDQGKLDETRSYSDRIRMEVNSRCTKKFTRICRTDEMLVQKEGKKTGCQT